MNENSNLTEDEKLELEILRILVDDELTEEEQAKKIMELIHKVTDNG